MAEPNTYGPQVKWMTEEEFREMHESEKQKRKRSAEESRKVAALSLSKRKKVLKAKQKR